MPRKRDIRRSIVPGRPIASMSQRVIELDLGASNTFGGTGSGGSGGNIVVNNPPGVPGKERGTFTGFSGAFFAVDADGYHSVGPLTAGATWEWYVPFRGRIRGWSLASKTRGGVLVAETATVGIEKNPYDADGPAPAWASITGGSNPSLVAFGCDSSTDLSDWTTGFEEGDEFRATLLTVGSATGRIELYLDVEVLMHYARHRVKA